MLLPYKTETLNFNLPLIPITLHSAQITFIELITNSICMQAEQIKHSSKKSYLSSIAIVES